MTNAPYQIDENTLSSEAYDKMRLWGVRHLPVVRGGNLLGVVTERDVQITILAGEISGYRPKMGDLCTKEPYVVNADAEVAEVVHHMAENKLDYALIADSKGAITGIFTSVDACRLLYRMLGK